MDIYYFDKPTIGYCRECDTMAIYSDRLHCPDNKDHELTLFIWDEDSPHPED